MPNFPPLCEWWHGPSGSGKTLEASRKYPNAYHKQTLDEYWDDYSGQDVVIIDNMNTEYSPYVHSMGKYLIYWSHGGICKVLDRSSDEDGNRGPVKMLGGPKKIIVISDSTPHCFWPEWETRDVIAHVFHYRQFYLPTTPRDTPPPPISSN